MKLSNNSLISTHTGHKDAAPPTNRPGGNDTNIFELILITFLSIPTLGNVKNPY